ncbi:hypothetical protein BST81_20445 [Leptolyngbya sp. 'hensonii']|uniref:hypothetical protein n=1 Tax=Leptolyngbya sp. 'hensonii' TaxID=1922337 RepID=UPI00094FDF4B|nr:hypothetical protein [Leptolyngbya sp. 'hensonii']OLP16569.1 hypothetical protein BST81_20445 [Leptolyngbya sp. 'hensonii']
MSSLATDYLPSTQGAASPFDIKPVVAQVLANGLLTMTDRQQLRQALLHEETTDEELELIEQVIEQVRQGTLQVMR